MKHSTHLICALTEKPSESGQHRSVRAMPTDFVPLRLVQQPGKLVLVLSQPEIVLGRHSLADVRLMMPYVSRRHCLFQFLGGIWQVSDLGSLNGMVVNGEKVSTVSLKQGDRISIGGLDFAVHCHAEVEPPVDSDTLVLNICDDRPTGIFRAAA